jgi:hypothetical protein
MTDANSPLRRYAAIGLAAWALTTIAIRLIPGAAFSLPAAGWIGAIAVGAAALAALARLIVRDISPAHRAAAMVALVLPGMAGDCLTSAFFVRVFPNLPAGGAGWFGGLMLLGYSVMLAAALAPGRRLAR